MDTKNLLISNREERLKHILKEHKKTDEDLKEYIKVLKTWFKNQPHLPEIPSDIMITAFLILNKFSIENSKIKLDMYYTMRSLIPEIYQNKNPGLAHMKEVADKIYVIPLPKLTKEGYRVTILKMIYENADDFDPYNFFGHTYNILEVRLHEDVPSGDILVYDLECFKMGHILKTTPISVKKTILILEEPVFRKNTNERQIKELLKENQTKDLAPYIVQSIGGSIVHFGRKVFANRVKAMHFVNAAPYADRLFAIMKPLLKDKMKKRVHVDQKYNAILKSIPKDILPKDYGGEELSLFELNQLWKQKLVEYQDRFDALDKMRTKEELRPKPLVNDEILGFHGNFKKLNVD